MQKTIQRYVELLTKRDSLLFIYNQIINNKFTITPEENFLLFEKLQSITNGIMITQTLYNELLSRTSESQIKKVVDELNKELSSNTLNNNSIYYYNEIINSLNFNIMKKYKKTK